MGEVVHRETQGHLELATRGTTPVESMSVFLLSFEILILISRSRFRLVLNFSLPKFVGWTKVFGGRMCAKLAGFEIECEKNSRHEALNTVVISQDSDTVSSKL